MHTDGEQNNKINFMRVPDEDKSEQCDEFQRQPSDSIKFDRDSLQSKLRVFESLKNPGLVINKARWLKDYVPLEIELAHIQSLPDYTQRIINPIPKEKLLRHFTLWYIKDSDWYVPGMGNELTMQVYHMSKHFIIFYNFYFS